MVIVIITAIKVITDNNMFIELLLGVEYWVKKAISRQFNLLLNPIKSMRQLSPERVSKFLPDVTGRVGVETFYSQGYGTLRPLDFTN